MRDKARQLTFTQNIFSSLFNLRKILQLHKSIINQLCLLISLVWQRIK